MEFNINGKVYAFDNVAKRTRNGFNHISTLSIDGVNVAEATIHYINRTWEAYQFQTSMRVAVNNLCDKLIAGAISRYKEANAIERFKAGQKQAVITGAKQFPEYKELEELLEAISRR